MKKIIVAVIAFVVLLAFAFAIGVPGKNVTYSFTPSFKSHVDYSFDDYPKISGYVSNIIKTCSDIESKCIVNLIKEIKDYDFYFKNKGNIITAKEQKDWNTYCEANEEDFFYDVVELYDNCISSIGEKCRCELDTSRYKSGITINSRSEENCLVLSFPSKGISEDVCSDSLKIDLPAIKSNGNKIVLIKDILNKKLSSADDKLVIDECIADNKLFKACAVTGKKIYGTNPITNTIGLNNVVVRFAFRILDLPPPPLNGVNISDKKKASSRLLVKWNKSDATDVAKYAIYYSTTDFKGINLSECITKAICKKVELSAVSTVVKGIDLAAEPLFNNVLGEYNHGYEDKKLYQLKSDTENYYFYSLEVLENTRYFVAVTAIDRDGNEIDNSNKGRLVFNENYAEAESVDDIPAGKVDAPTIDSSSQLYWTEPKENIDGTILDINSIIDYWIYEIVDSELLKIGEIGEPPYPVDPTKTYNVLAVKRSAPIAEKSL
jgi:hypothetical protein